MYMYLVDTLYSYYIILYIFSIRIARKVFLDILMDVSDKGKKFTRKDILDEINTVAFAVSIISFVIYTVLIL